MILCRVSKNISRNIQQKLSFKDKNSYPSI